MIIPAQSSTNNNNKMTTAVASIALLSSKFRLIVPSAIRDMTTLKAAREIGGHHYEPADVDIFCGRGKGFYNRPGNKTFRTLVCSYIPAYLAAKTKVDKSAVLNTIVDKVRALTDPVTGRPAQFIKFSKKTGWVEIGDEQAREKVGHAMREAISSVEEQQQGVSTGGVLPTTSLLPGNNNSKKCKMTKAAACSRGKPQQQAIITSQPMPLPIYSAPVESISVCRQEDSSMVMMEEDLGDAEPYYLNEEFARQMPVLTTDPTNLLWRPISSSMRRGSAGRSSFLSRDSMSSEMMRAAIESFIGI
jgi:hypothetical protein